MARTHEQQRGIDFEERVAEVLGGRIQPGSGNQFHAQGDVRAGGLLLSCKSQQKFSWTEMIRYLNEAQKCAMGTGDIPALALDDVDSGQQIVILNLEDLGSALGGTVNLPVFTGSKGEAKRKLAKTPVLLRD